MFEEYGHAQTMFVAHNNRVHQLPDDWRFTHYSKNEIMISDAERKCINPSNICFHVLIELPQTVTDNVSETKFLLQLQLYMVITGDYYHIMMLKLHSSIMPQFYL